MSDYTLETAIDKVDDLKAQLMLTEATRDVYKGISINAQRDHIASAKQISESLALIDAAVPKDTEAYALVQHLSLFVACLISSLEKTR